MPEIDSVPTRDPVTAEPVARGDPAPGGRNLGLGEERRPIDAPGRTAQPRRPLGIPLTAAWIVTAIVLVTAGWFSWRDRAAVMRAWPPVARVYAALGAGNKR